MTATVFAATVLLFSPTVNAALVARWISNPPSSSELSVQPSVMLAFLPDTTAEAVRFDGAAGALAEATVLDTAYAEEPPAFTAATRC